jgi:hypothetical protein
MATPREVLLTGGSAESVSGLPIGGLLGRWRFGNLMNQSPSLAYQFALGPYKNKKLDGGWSSCLPDGQRLIMAFGLSFNTPKSLA